MLLATGFILILALPAWAAEEKKCTTYEDKKAGKKPPYDELIKKVQKLLQVAGAKYDPGNIDGFCGPDTLTAMNNFQKNNELKETQWPDELTLKKLSGVPPVPVVKNQL